MKVLIVSKFYYYRGGDCTAVFSTEKILRSKGHETAIFSVKHPQNEPSAWERYFPKMVSFSSGLRGKISAMTHLFHSREVSRKFKKILSDFKPDVVHLHNIHSYISPLVAKIAHKRGIRVVWTMHDYKLICPAYICLRENKLCEECFKNKHKVFKHKCMKNSYVASFLGWMEACFWNRKKLSGYTDLFIASSQCLKDKMVLGGYSPEQITVLHNFLPNKIPVSTEKEDYYCFVGRLTVEKGVDSLLESAAQLPYNLKIIGGGPLLDYYKEKYQQKHIEFLGQMSPEELFPILQKSRFLVIPSIWYENSPHSLIESLRMGTPVLGARIGGIPEMIVEGEDGFLFTPGNVAELRDKTIECFNLFTNSYNFLKIAEAAQNKFGGESFYNKLMKIYVH